MWILYEKNSLVLKLKTKELNVIKFSRFFDFKIRQIDKLIWTHCCQTDVTT